MATLPRYTGTQYRCIDLGRDLCAAGQPIAYRRLDPGRLVTTSRRVGRVTGLRAQELLLQGQQAAPTRVPLTPASWLRQICCPAHLKVRGRGTLVLGCTKVLPMLGRAPHWSPRTYREGQGHMRAQRAQGSHVPVSLVWRHMAIERRHIVLPQKRKNFLWGRCS